MITLKGTCQEGHAAQTTASKKEPQVSLLQQCEIYSETRWSKTHGQTEPAGGDGSDVRLLPSGSAWLTALPRIPHEIQQQSASQVCEWGFCNSNHMQWEISAAVIMGMPLISGGNTED